MDNQFNNNGMGMMPQGKKGMCIAALVLGIVACVFCWIPYVSIIAIICAGIGTLLGIMGFKSYKDLGQSDGMAVAGLVLALVGLGLSIIGFFTCTLPVIRACCYVQNAASSLTSSDLSSLYKYLN